MTATPNVTAPSGASQFQAPIHFPQEAMSRLHDELLYQIAATNLVKATMGETKGATFTQDEMRAMQHAYTRGVSFAQFAQCVIDAREMAYEQVSA